MRAICLLVIAFLELAPGAAARVQEAPHGEPAPDEEPESLDHAVLGGTWWLRLRYRVEHVDQDGFSRDAWASTLRTVLGYESAPWHRASVLLEFEDVSVIGNERYDSTVNGETGYPVVADPEGSEVNQAQVKYLPAEGVRVQVGRQVLTLDNHRFVGDVGWRQNQQTFDAATVLWQPAEEWQLLYGFIDNVNRVFGEDSPQGDHRMASHLLHASRDFESVGQLTGYAYLLDYDSVDVLSSNTVGLRFVGEHALGEAALLYTGEYAQQVDAGDNPNDVDQDYLLGKLGARVGAVTFEVGEEVLGGSGDPGDAFQTPIATLHAFNGWADEFLTTPDAGLEDFSLALGAKRGDFALQLAWHDFQANSGGADYGTELDASLVWSASKQVSFGLKAADYQAEDFGADTTKAWLWMAYAP